MWFMFSINNLINIIDNNLAKDLLFKNTKNISLSLCV